MSLCQRLLVTMLAVSVVMLVILVGFASYFLHGTNERNFAERTRIISRLVTAGLTDPIISADLARVDDIIGSVISANDGLVRVCAFDNKGNRLSTCRCRSLSDTPFPDERIIEMPVLVSGETFGAVGIAFSAATVSEEVRQVEMYLFVVAVGLLGFAALIAWWVSDGLTKQINAITFALQHDEAADLPVTSARCELDRVAQAINDLHAQRRQAKTTATPPTES